jgi:hypothetical protein
MVFAIFTISFCFVTNAIANSTLSFSVIFEDTKVFSAIELTWASNDSGVL